jgi:hypothetical protein
LILFAGVDDAILLRFGNKLIEGAEVGRDAAEYYGLGGFEVLVFSFECFFWI